MSRSKSSKRWLKEHISDHFVKQAQIEGYRSRAVYKLKEVDQKEKLFKSGMTIVDLGAAPGGWSQYVSGVLRGKGKIFALDILPIDPILGVEIIQGDFQEDSVVNKISSCIMPHSVDVVLSDMAPNMTGLSAVDIPRAMYLVELAIDFSESMLKKDGALFVKIFHGAGFEELLKKIRAKFKRVVVYKPQASRSRSRETYLLARGYNL